MSVAMGGVALAAGIASAIMGPNKAKLKQAGADELTMRGGMKKSLRRNMQNNQGAMRDFNNLSPLLYELGGVEGDYRVDPRLQAPVDRLSAKHQRLTAKGKNKKAAKVGEKLYIAQQKLDIKPKTLTNVRAKRLGTADDQAIEDLMTARVKNALTTGESSDPRLNHELTKQQAMLQAGLSQRGMAGSSLGAATMAEFEQNKAESLADFARKDISEYNPMRLQQRATLADIAGKMQDLALKPIGARLGIGTAFGETAGRYRESAQMYQHERIEKMKADVAAAGTPNAFDKIAGAAGMASGLGNNSFAAGPSQYGAGGMGPPAPATARGMMSDAWGGAQSGYNRFQDFFGRSSGA